MVSTSGSGLTSTPRSRSSWATRAGLEWDMACSHSRSVTTPLWSASMNLCVRSRSGASNCRPSSCTAAVNSIRSKWPRSVWSKESKPSATVMSLNLRRAASSLMASSTSSSGCSGAAGSGSVQDKSSPTSTPRSASRCFTATGSTWFSAASHSASETVPLPLPLGLMNRNTRWHSAGENESCSSPTIASKSSIDTPLSDRSNVS
mmetsp:Transcript_17427/g.41011  ORF Transcript_17427/g.41011 Transcript_17427/m.41011 type:complete len:204 (-) Transcript_17427:1822-2433(-)